MVDDSEPRSSSKGVNHQAPSKPVKKRNRALLSCVSCHKRRVKCDRQNPCEACVVHGGVCEYAPRPNKRQHAIEGDWWQSYGKYEERPDAANGRGRVEAIPPPTQLPEQHFSLRDDTAPASYPVEVIAIMNSIRSDLPSVEKTELLLDFFREELEWMYLVGDFDSMEVWLLPLLERLKKSGSYADGMKELDVTRLALIVAFIMASVQIANEGLTKVCFLDVVPNSLKTQADITRDGIQSSYESYLRKLLDLASQYDGPSPDLIRASLVYHVYLRNEGKHGEDVHEGAAAQLVENISSMVRSMKLHLDPSSKLPKRERESRRRLFQTYLNIDRINCVTLGLEIRISNDEITIKEPEEEYFSEGMKWRTTMCLNYKARLVRLIEPYLKKLRSIGIDASDIQEYERNLQEWVKSLPEALKPSLPRLDHSLKRYHKLDLERHFLQASYLTTRGALHRTSFFPSEKIPLEQVNVSRQICVDAALSMIKLMEGLRMRIVSGHHLRCAYVPLFTLESSITLILASLIELSNAAPSVGKGRVPAHVREYMRWAGRGRDLLLTIPTDFTPAVQAVKLVSRVLLKASKIIDLHENQIVTNTDSKTAIRDVLHDDDGRPMAIPFLEQNYARRSGVGIRPPTSNARSHSNMADTDSHAKSMSTQASSSASSDPLLDPFTFQTSTLRSTAPNNKVDGNWNANDSMTAFNLGTGEPTYAEVGLDFFNTLSAALQPVESPSHNWSSMEQSHPSMSNQSLDAQMDAWLATLQNYV